MIGLYAITYSVLSVLRHETYHSFGYDLGLYDQVFWNTVHGRWWESTMSLGLTQPHSYFGDHFAPIYLAILPVYALFPHPETLLILQSLSIALGAVPIYLLARAIFPATAQPVVWVAAYLLFLPVAHISLLDFHETALSILPLGMALYFLVGDRVVWFLGALAIAILVKEEMALIGLGFGVYILVARRRWVLGTLVTAGSLAAFLTILYVIIPAFSGGRGFAYFGRYAELGSSPFAILRTVVTHPGVVIHTLARRKKAAFLVGLFGPVLGLPVLSGFGLILLAPTLGYLLLSSDQSMYSFTTQYSAPLIPLILGTAILGLARVPARVRARVSAAVLVSSLVFAYAYGNVPGSHRFDVNQFLPEARYAAFAPALRSIPAGASVATENDLTPHLDQRRYIYDIDFEGSASADYVALDTAATRHDLATFRGQVDAFRGEGYLLIATEPGLALLKRAGP